METTEERLKRLEKENASIGQEKNEQDATTGKHANHVQSRTWMFSLHTLIPYYRNRTHRRPYREEEKKSASY